MEKERAYTERLAGQIQEVVNRNTLVSLVLPTGYNAFLPVYDAGVDLILYRESDGALRKVQLKGRWTIDRKYLGRDIWVAFPVGVDWFLMPHDKMVRAAPTYTATTSWKDGGIYHAARPRPDVLDACQPYRLRPIEEVAGEAAAAAGAVPDALAGK